MRFRFTVFAILALAVMFVSMTSCVKKYTCQCVFKYSGYPGLPDSSVNEYDITDSKSGAKSKCAGESKTYDNNNIHTVETCTLY